MSRGDSQVAEAPNELGLVEHICCNFHPPHAVHCLKEVHKFRLRRGYSRPRCLNMMGLVLSDLHNNPAR